MADDNHSVLRHDLLDYVASQLTDDRDLSVRYATLLRKYATEDALSWHSCEQTDQGLCCGTRAVMRHDHAARLDPEMTHYTIGWCCDYGENPQIRYENGGERFQLYANRAYLRALVVGYDEVDKLYNPMLQQHRARLMPNPGTDISRSWTFRSIVDPADAICISRIPVMRPSCAPAFWAAQRANDMFALAAAIFDRESEMSKMDSIVEEMQKFERDTKLEIDVLAAQRVQFGHTRDAPLWRGLSCFPTDMHNLRLLCRVLSNDPAYPPTRQLSRLFRKRDGSVELTYHDCAFTMVLWP